MQFTVDELKATIEKHRKWILNENGGERADLYGAENSEYADALTMIPCEGSIIGWKKAHNPDGGHCIVKLRIPEEAKRSSSTGRKCRAEWAEVIEVIGAEYAISDHADENGVKLEYRAGQTVRPDKWDTNRWEECSGGIHFFVSRIEAENYDLQQTGPG